MFNVFLTIFLFLAFAMVIAGISQIMTDEKNRTNDLKMILKTMTDILNDHQKSIEKLRIDSEYTNKKLDTIGDAYVDLVNSFKKIIEQPEKPKKAKGSAKKKAENREDLEQL